MQQVCILGQVAQVADQEQNAIRACEIIETLHPSLAASQNEAEPGHAADVATTVKEILAGKEVAILLHSCGADDKVEKAAPLLQALRKEVAVSLPLHGTGMP